MRKFLMLIACLGLSVALAGCGTSVKRVETEETIDLSGRWNDTDSRLVSEEMIQDALNRPWLGNYRSAHGKKPVVIVGTVENRTSEHLGVQTFTKDLERALLNSGQVDFVATKFERSEIREERQDQAAFAREDTIKRFAMEVGADFMLKGAINSIIDQEGRRSVRYYQVNLELIDMESNLKVWIGEKKVKKYVRRGTFKP